VQQQTRRTKNNSIKRMEAQGGYDDQDCEDRLVEESIACPSDVTGEAQSEAKVTDLVGLWENKQGRASEVGLASGPRSRRSSQAHTSPRADNSECPPADVSCHVAVAEMRCGSGQGDVQSVIDSSVAEAPTHSAPSISSAASGSVERVAAESADALPEPAVVHIAHEKEAPACDLMVQAPSCPSRSFTGAEATQSIVTENFVDQSLEPAAPAVPSSPEVEALAAAAFPMAAELTPPVSACQTMSVVLIEEHALSKGLGSVGSGLVLGCGGQDELEQVQDFSSEPIEQRFASKDLNRRCSAYAEAIIGMEAMDESMFALFRSKIGTCLGETLPKGQDAALSALAMFLEKAPDLEKEDAEIRGLVRALIEHKTIDKPKMQQLAVQVITLVCEICECPAVVQEMSHSLTALENAKKKTLGFFKKQVAFIAKLFYHLLADFGPQKMNPRLGFLGVTLKNISDSDRGIKESCYSVFVELSSWLGDIGEFVQTMEEPQKKELAKRLADQTGDGKSPKEPKRCYRGERRMAVEKSAPSVSHADGGQAVISDGAAASSSFVDSYDMLDPVDIFKRLPKGWCLSKVLGMEKWKEKQTHLKVLVDAVDVPRLKACSEGFAELVPVLLRLLKSESAIPIVTEVARSIGFMARGLRRDFERPARQLLPVFLAKMLDKSLWKPTVLVEPVQSLLWAMPFDSFMEEVRPYVANKSTFVKKEALALFSRAIDLPAVLHSGDASTCFFVQLADTALSAVDDADSAVRLEAFKFLACLIHRNQSASDVGELVGRIPQSRRGAFEDEWRKLANDVSCPGGCGGARPKESGPSAPSGRRDMPPAKEGSTTAASSRIGAPTKNHAPRSRASNNASASREPTPQRQRSQGQCPGDVDSGVPTTEFQDLKAQIGLLQSKVEHLQNERELGANAASEVGANSTRLRAPSAGRAIRRAVSHDRTEVVSAAGAARATSARRQRPTSAGPSSRSVAPPPPTVLGELLLELPRIPKQARQHKERAQYWGPDEIPVAYLMSLKEGLRTCVCERVFKSMFSRKMEEQLSALQAWKHLGATQFDDVYEMLDMSLKWLTWMLFNTNTQVWKLVLEVLKGILDGLVERDIELTDREAMILVPSIVERSGHNMLQLRESLVSIVKVLPQVYPPVKLLPSLLRGLLSKNKKSVSCTAHLIGEIGRDRQVASSLMRSQKDVIKLLDANDIEIRRAAVGILAALSVSVDGDMFAKILKTLPTDVQRSVTSAASQLPLSEGPNSPNCSVDMDATCLDSSICADASISARNRGTAAPHVPAPRAAFGRPASPARASSRNPAPMRQRPASPAPVTMSPAKRSSLRTATPVKNRLRLPSPLRCSASAAATPAVSASMPSPPSAEERQDVSRVEHVEVAPRAAQSMTDSSMYEASMEQASLAMEALTDAPLGKLVEKLKVVDLHRCNAVEFEAVCGTVVERMLHTRISMADVPFIVEALFVSMRAYLGAETHVARWWPLVKVMETFSTSRDLVRAVDREMLRNLLRELLKFLFSSIGSNSWTKKVPEGSALATKVNLTCVVLLNSMYRPLAFGLLLELQLTDSDVIGTSTAQKCARKLNKASGMSAKRGVPNNADGKDIAETIRNFAGQLVSQLPTPEEGDDPYPELSPVLAACLANLREVMQAARRACLEADEYVMAPAFAESTRGQSERRLVEYILDTSGAGIAIEKENVGPVSPADVLSGGKPKLSLASRVSYVENIVGHR